MLHFLGTFSSTFYVYSCECIRASLKTKTKKKNYIFISLHFGNVSFSSLCIGSSHSEHKNSLFLFDAFSKIGNLFNSFKITEISNIFIEFTCVKYQNMKVKIEHHSLPSVNKRRKFQMIRFYMYGYLKIKYLPPTFLISYRNFKLYLRLFI